MSVAHRVFKWHKDKSVYFHVFVRLLQSGQKEQATEVLKKNFHFIQFDKVTSFIDGEENFDSNLNEFYQKAFVEVEKLSKELKVLKSIT